MIRKRLTNSVVVAVLVISVVGGGAVATGVLAANGADNNDSRESATEMAVNSTETGTIEANDTDWYAFDVEAGERINVDLTMTTDNEENLHFDIIGPNGEEAEAYPNDALGPGYTTHRIISGPSAFGGDIAEQSGTYYVKVRSAGDSIDEPTEYELTVETQKLDQYDPNEQPASATPVESGETISAVMSGSDNDVYAIDLEKGETVNVTTNHSNSVLVNTQLLGPNASDVTFHGFLSEHVVAWDYSDSFIYTANASGTHFIRVTTHEEGIGSFDKEAPYELSVTSSGDDSSDETDNDSETDDGPTETPDEEDSTDDGEDSPQNDSTEAPSDTDDTDNTEQSEPNESVDEDANTADNDADVDTPTETDDAEPTESDETVDDTDSDTADDSVADGTPTETDQSKC